MVLVFEAGKVGSHQHLNVVTIDDPAVTSIANSWAPMVSAKHNVDDKCHSRDVNIIYRNALTTGTPLHPRHPSLPPMQHLLYTNDEA